ncbi:hypothetical protein OAF27_01835 [Verrucomicrobiales bacterium]|nr:hypothetical protein [Verrucomicrobiales bacterium]
MAAETSIAALTSIRGGFPTNIIASSYMKEVLKKSRERSARFIEIVGNRQQAEKPVFDPRLNALLDRAFGRFGGKSESSSAVSDVVTGITELRIYQKKMITDFRSALRDGDDQECRNWASEEMVKIQCDIAQLNELASVPSPAPDFAFRMAS